jgi:ribosomal protein L13
MYRVLKGKHADLYPFGRHRRFIVVVNPKKVALTGKKRKDKKYYHHRYPGGTRETRRKLWPARPR